MILVQFEQTQNPDVVRIFPDDFGTPFCSDPDRCRGRGCQLKLALLAIDGIADVAIEREAITVTRADPSLAWVMLWTQIDQAIFAISDTPWLAPLRRAA